MSACLLDTDWAIQAIAGRPQAVNILHNLLAAGVAVSIITIAELYEGAFNSPNPAAHLARSRAFLQSYEVYDINDPVVERFAELCSYLRRRGELLPDFDLLIAATALHNNVTLLTYNIRHFQRIPDLRLFQPG